MKTSTKPPVARKPVKASNAATAVAPLSERRQRRADEILAAARQVFLEKGFQGTAVSEIANRVGIAEGLVFNYFPTKRDLLHEVLRAMYEPLIRDVEEGFARIQGLRSRLRFIVWRHVRVYVETPGLAKLVLHEVRTGPEYTGAGLHDLQVRYTQFVRLALEDAVRDGELAAGVDVDAVRAMLYGGLEHLMWPTLYGNQRINVDSVVDSYTNLMLHGLQATPTVGGVEARLARLEALLATGRPPRA
ncbi:transcriptional regulator, TetR family [Variovorax sp. HW608]|uniref:TetR/AcrR family transcriptional regulator n=1 Tax=Variovorax sp. HW608 TaxID=1034889 RepID=UPI00081F83C8|nr:TetR/AcrR family transcriptional regulator [Variovorax sp. HW608]SCK09929.1 transcriptional regulator, TetR family [Variovorax sp. HW608]